MRVRVLVSDEVDTSRARTCSACMELLRRQWTLLRLLWLPAGSIG